MSLKVLKGTTLGIVGESGCGKSTLVKGIIGLEALTDGKVELMGIDLNQPAQKRDLSLIRELQMVFQNPDSTLNPSYTIGAQIGRPIQKFKTVPRKKSARSGAAVAGRQTGCLLLRPVSPAAVRW